LFLRSLLREAEAVFTFFPKEKWSEGVKVVMQVGVLEILQTS